MTDSICQIIESDGDQLVDLHLCRLGPGHQGAIVHVATTEQCATDLYRARLRGFKKTLSHLTVVLCHAGDVPRSALLMQLEPWAENQASQINIAPLCSPQRNTIGCRFPCKSPRHHSPKISCGFGAIWVSVSALMRSLWGI